MIVFVLIGAAALVAVGLAASLFLLRRGRAARFVLALVIVPLVVLGVVLGAIGEVHRQHCIDRVDRWYERNVRPGQSFPEGYAFSAEVRLQA
jgi:hypothetical protein